MLNNWKIPSAIIRTCKHTSFVVGGTWGECYFHFHLKFCPDFSEYGGAETGLNLA